MSRTGWQRYAQRASSERAPSDRLVPALYLIVSRSKDSIMTIKTGWTGRYYEDFEVGDIYPHPLGRTVTQTDNIWFTLLTVNPNPIHFDAVYAAKTEYGRPLVDSTFTLALVTGLSVGDLSQNAINMGWEEVRLPHPVFDGDTLYARSEVLSMRESKSQAARGIVQVKTTGFNQDGKVVIEFKRTIMVYKRGAAPSSTQLPPFVTEMSGGG
jgi:itaconyl-CoA hydratase